MDKAGFIFYLFLIVSIFFGLPDNFYGAENPLEKGIAEYKAENYEEAVEFLIKAREQQPNSSVAAFYLGLTYKQTGDYKQAAKQFREATQLTPTVVESYTELIEVLYHLNELKEAREWIAKAEKEDIKLAQVKFLKGLVFVKENKDKEAIEAFKKAKEIDPSLTQASDLQISMIYVRQKRFAQAKESLKALISLDPISELAYFAKEYDEALSKVVEAYRTWRVTAGVAYQYDDNVVLEPSTGVAIPTGKKDSSVVTNVSLNYYPLLSEPWVFSAQYNVYGNFYADLNTYNLVSQTISLNPGYNFQNGAFTLPIAYSYIWFDERSYQWVLLAKPTVNLILSPNHIGQFYFEYARREMMIRPINRYEDRDGNIYVISPGYFRPFSGGRGIFNMRYEFSIDNTEGKNWENIGNRFALNLLVPLPFIDKMSLTISGDVFWQRYQHTHTVFEEKRKDTTYFVSGGLIWEFLKELNLNLKYSYTRADSSIGVYDYRRNVYNIGLEYIF